MTVRRGGYDSLSAGDQALTRAAWDEQLAENQHKLNFEAEFIAAGESWVEADSGGRTLTRGRRAKTKSPEADRSRHENVARPRTEDH